MAISPDGEILAAAGGNDYTIYLWEARSGKRLAALVGDSVAGPVAFSPDGRLVTDGTNIYNIRTGERLASVAGVPQLSGVRFLLLARGDGDWVAATAARDRHLEPLATCPRDVLGAVDATVVGRQQAWSEAAAGLGPALANLPAYSDVPWAASPS